MSRAVMARTERGTSSEVPHLSHSRIDRYLRCPDQYRFYYVQGFRLRRPAAGMVFGQLLHDALAGRFRFGADPRKSFEESWAELRTVELTYNQRESWENLAESGEALLEMFLAEEANRITDIEAVEASFSLTITSLGVPFVGVVDLVARLDGRRTVIDFKTAVKDYEDHAVILNDQLTAYSIARPEADEVALAVFVKGRAPRIEWHRAKREPAQVTEYLTKAEVIGRAINRGEFYKRSGWWCSGWDFLPICIGDQKLASETLVRVAA